MLAKRLARYGLAVSAGSLAAMLAQHTASASAPASVVGSTIKAASLFAAGKAAAAGGISVQAVALMEGVLKTMLLTKLKIATTVVLGVGLLGISWGLYPIRAASPPEEKPEAAPPPPSEFGAPDKEGGQPAKDGQGEKMITLPKGPPPIQVLVNLAEDGKLLVKSEHMLVNMGARLLPLPAGQMPAPMPGDLLPGPHVRVRAIKGRFGPMQTQGGMKLSYDLKDIQVLDTKGKKVGMKELAKLLKDETVAVASFGDQPIDPLHLRILKEGTLVFILPVPEGEIPLPGGNQAMLPELGPGTFRVLFHRTWQTRLETGEQ